MEEIEVVDEDWVEKFSDQHKRKFWKNKTTGKSSWTEPPKIKKMVPKSGGGGGGGGGGGSGGMESADVEEETEEIIVPDADYEESYDVQRKRKIWKHKTSGKLLLTEPTVTKRVPLTAATRALRATASLAAVSKESKKVSEPQPDLPSSCGFLWEVTNKRWVKYAAKVCMDSRSASWHGSCLVMYANCQDCSFILTSAEQGMLRNGSLDQSVASEESKDAQASSMAPLPVKPHRMIDLALYGTIRCNLEVRDAILSIIDYDSNLLYLDNCSGPRSY